MYKEPLEALVVFLIAIIVRLISKKKVTTIDIIGLAAISILLVHFVYNHK